MPNATPGRVHAGMVIGRLRVARLCDEPNAGLAQVEETAPSGLVFTHTMPVWALDVLAAARAMVEYCDRIGAPMEHARCPDLLADATPVRLRRAVEAMAGRAPCTREARAGEAADRFEGLASEHIRSAVGLPEHERAAKLAEFLREVACDCAMASTFVRPELAEVGEGDEQSFPAVPDSAEATNSFSFYAGSIDDDGEPVRVCIVCDGVEHHCESCPVLAAERTVERVEAALAAAGYSTDSMGATVTAIIEELGACRHAERSLRGELATWREWASSLLGYAVDDGTAHARLGGECAALREERDAARGALAKIVSPPKPDASS